jgi:GTPase SAR1 family protein
VLLLGQYSTGKTSFIQYLVGREFPGSRVGPEPTTDRFVAIMVLSYINSSHMGHWHQRPLLV